MSKKKKTVTTDRTISNINIGNFLANVVYQIENEIADAVEENRNPFNSKMTITESQNCLIFSDIEYQENVDAGIDNKVTIYVAKVLVKDKDNEPIPEKTYYQICVDSFVNGSLCCQYRHSTDKATFDACYNYYTSKVAVSITSNLKK